METPMKNETPEPWLKVEMTDDGDRSVYIRIDYLGFIAWHAVVVAFGYWLAGGFQ
jgi:hypothetical protein